jgi:hypothetical protein
MKSGEIEANFFFFEMLQAFSGKEHTPCVSRGANITGDAE